VGIFQLPFVPEKKKTNKKVYPEEEDFVIVSIP
jgi:hypothetical protein